QSQRAGVLPNARRGRDEVGAKAREPLRVADAVDIPSDTRHNEDLGPPSDEIGDLIDDIDAGLARTEGHVIGAHLSEAHRGVTAQAAAGADVCAADEQVPRGGVSVSISNPEMDAVGAKPLGEFGVVLKKTGGPARLDKIDEPANVLLVNRRVAVAKRRASRIGALQRLSELSFELCRRLCWKLQIEPASRLDFSHCRGLRRLLKHTLGVTAPALKSYGSQRCQLRKAGTNKSDSSLLNTGRIVTTLSLDRYPGTLSPG